MLDILRDLAISQSFNVWLCPAPFFACTEGCVILRSLVLCASSVAGYFDISNFFSAEMQRRAGEVVQSMREGLTQGLGSTVNDWMYEFGERKTPEPSLLSQRLDSWRFGKGGVSGPQVNV